MYRKCLHIKCIPHFDKLLSTFCTQKLDGTGNIYLLFPVSKNKCVKNHMKLVLHTFT